MSNDEYYLNIAKAVAQDSKCLKAKYGALIVKDDAMLSAGYNGPARKAPHCEECPRLNGDVGGSAYDMQCPAVHAEENAIIHAAHHGSSVKGAKLYLWGDYPPCQKCARALINAGIKEVITKEEHFSKDELYELAQPDDTCFLESDKPKMEE